MPKARKAYDELTAAACPEDVESWMADAEAADDEREHHVESMDIYDVHSKPRKLEPPLNRFYSYKIAVPTQKDVQIQLADEELREQDLSSGSSSAWLAAGIKIEERKWVRR